MKRTLLSLVLALMCLLPLAACGQAEEPAPESELLQAMHEPNTNASMLERHSRIASRITYTYVDGTQDTVYGYLDPDRYYDDGPHGWSVDQGSQVYGYNKDEQRLYVDLFVKNAYEEYQAQEVVSGYSYVPGISALVSQEEVDGELVVTTTSKNKWYVQVFPQTFGYEPGSIREIRFRYTVDPETYELRGTVGTFLPKVKRGEEAQEILFLETEIFPDPQAVYVPDPQVEAQVFSQDRRTITLVVDPNKPMETTHTFEAPKGLAVRMHVPSEYTQAVYLDSDCTKFFLNEDDGMEDLTLYAKSYVDKK